MIQWWGRERVEEGGRGRELVDTLDRLMDHQMFCSPALSSTQSLRHNCSGDKDWVSVLFLFFISFMSSHHIILYSATVSGVAGRESQSDGRGIKATYWEILTVLCAVLVLDVKTLLIL